MEVKLFEQDQDLEYTHTMVSSPAFLDLAACEKASAGMALPCNLGQAAGRSYVRRSWRILDGNSPSLGQELFVSSSTYHAELHLRNIVSGLVPH